VPHGPQIDLLLAKAEPISNSGSTSMTTYLRRGKKPAQCQLQQERGKRMCETTQQAPRSVREGEEVLQVPEQRFPYSSWRSRFCLSLPYPGLIGKRLN